MKEKLWSQLRGIRDVFVWKLEGLGEYDLRRPMTRTGTNLLGVMKHVAVEEYGYLGEVFGRSAPEQIACFADGSVWDGRRTLIHLTAGIRWFPDTPQATFGAISDSILAPWLDAMWRLKALSLKRSSRLAGGSVSGRR